MIGSNFNEKVIVSKEEGYELSGKSCNMALCQATIERIM